MSADREAAWLRCRDEFKAKPIADLGARGARWFFDRGWDALRDEAREQVRRAGVTSALLEAERDLLAERVRRLTEALEHYADEGNWSHDPDPEGKYQQDCYNPPGPYRPGYEVARAALADADAPPQEMTDARL